MRILLIGATSYVASPFVEECLRREWDVFALTRDRVSQKILAVSGGDRVVAVVGADQLQGRLLDPDRGRGRHEDVTRDERSRDRTTTAVGGDLGARGDLPHREQGGGPGEPAGSP